MIFRKLNLLRSLVGMIRPHYAGLYRKYCKEISGWENLIAEEQKERIFQKCKNIVDFAFYRTAFYHRFYQANHFSPEMLKKFDDLQRIPIINKKILLDVPLEQRTSDIQPRTFFNTGGSSGVSLCFYEDRHLNAKENAHMFYMWRHCLGFEPAMCRLRLTGRSNIQDFTDYQYFQNIISWDIYADFSKVATSFKEKRNAWPEVYFLHGYPSALYEFSLYCEKDAELRNILRKTLKGVLFCSEYPFDLWRNKIEQVFGVKTLSWYGHTEACVLAYEKTIKEVYVPFQTYGFTEALQIDDGDYHLIGTDYYNCASPMIRYDTEDSICEPVMDLGLLKSFKIKNGRAGQYIQDSDGKNIALTGLIFGRHHALFDYCTNIQIASWGPGKAKVYYVLKAPELPLKNPEILFNSENVKIDFVFQEIPSPIKTKNGKVHLLVKVQE